MGVTVEIGQRRFWNDVTIAAAVVAAVTAVRVVALAFSQLDLYGDEAQYWSWAQVPDFGYFSKPPMVAWIIALTTGVCGDGEACVRLSSPLLHGATSMVLFAVAGTLYDRRTGLWTAMLHVSLPAVSFSSFLVSTDVPLLFFWSLALLALVRLRAGGELRAAAALGLAVGLGLLSKYAMLYFAGSALLAAAVDRRTRTALLGVNGVVAAALGALLVAPNVLWNVQHGWATVGHTAANANWQDISLHFDSLAEFVGGQFALLGPLLLIAFGVAAVRACRRTAKAEDRLLAAFSVPILLVISVQALVSRAHANWAATAIPAAVVLAAAWLSWGRWRWVRGASLALHGVAGLLLVLAATGAAPLTAMLPKDPLARVQGWDELGGEVRRRLQVGVFSAVLTDDREVVASLKYYLPERDVPVVVWGRPGPPLNHFELTSLIDRANGRRVLYVATAEHPENTLARFTAVQSDGEFVIRVGARQQRRFHFYILENFMGF